jgi:hypothetical protein
MIQIDVLQKSKGVLIINFCTQQQQLVADDQGICADFFCNHPYNKLARGRMKICIFFKLCVWSLLHASS